LAENFSNFNIKSKNRNAGDAYLSLFLSMISPAERYLSEAAGSSKKIANFFGMKHDSKLKLEGENLKNKEPENIEFLLERAKPHVEMPPLKKAKKADEGSFLKGALKNLYGGFSYFSGYAASQKNEVYTAADHMTKKAMITVKKTLAKILKIGEYIMAQSSPQWNMPMGTFNDRDTLAHEISPSEIINTDPNTVNYYTRKN